jgi:hypothetical protein
VGRLCQAWGWLRPPKAKDSRDSGEKEAGSRRKEEIAGENEWKRRGGRGRRGLQGLNGLQELNPAGGAGEGGRMNDEG